MRYLVADVKRTAGDDTKSRLQSDHNNLIIETASTGTDNSAFGSSLTIRTNEKVLIKNNDNTLL